jgi:D-glycero-D-manno-heptose 1,7-bisphosphate phosphatase
LFTNQSAVGRGLCTMEDVLACNARMLELIGLGNIFTDVCIAPETPAQPSLYRKPSGRFILESVKKHDLDPSESYMIGDSVRDIEAGFEGGVGVAFIKNPTLEPSEVLPDQYAGRVPVYENIWEFVQTLRG